MTRSALCTATEDGSPVARATGVAVGLTGIAFLAAGLWARCDVRRALARERVVSNPDAKPASSPVRSARAARSMAELIRRNTVEATGGRTYSEIDAYVGAGGTTTSDAELAVRDERTGQPLENPDHDLWLQSTTLQTALMQAYVGFRLAELTIALGASFLATGVGLAAAGRRHRQLG